jgi:RHS repeat-associated protein
MCGYRHTASSTLFPSPLLKTVVFAGIVGYTYYVEREYDYKYEAGYVHRASQIGTRYYRYDLNGNVTAEQEGPFQTEARTGGEIRELGNDTYYIDNGWGLVNTPPDPNQARHYRREYERIEYTPYIESCRMAGHTIIPCNANSEGVDGELWIEKASMSNIDVTYRFTGKERDEETGLYYYGARYLDSKTGRWLSADPALGEYIPGAPVNDEARKRNQNLPGMGGVFNVVNLHLYHYAGNNPLKYTDPDGRDIFHSGKYPGWSEDAPQARIPYKDEMDPDSKKLGFSIHGTKINIGIGDLRLWKGDYGEARILVPLGQFFIGGAGGEIGFYDNDGKMIRGAELSNMIGLESSMMQLFSKSDNSLLAEYSEQSGWVTAFNLSRSGKKENMYTVNTFSFRTEAQATDFTKKLRAGEYAQGRYPYNGGENFNISQNGKDVIIKWGAPNE